MWLITTVRWLIAEYLFLIFQEEDEITTTIEPWINKTEAWVTEDDMKGSRGQRTSTTTKRPVRKGVSAFALSTAAICFNVHAELYVVEIGCFHER